MYLVLFSTVKYSTLPEQASYLEGVKTFAPFLSASHGVYFQLVYFELYRWLLYAWSYIKQSMHQPGKVANPTRGQLNRELDISLSPFAPENLVLRDGFESPVPRQPVNLHTQAESGAYLRDSSRVPRRRPFIYLKTAIRHRVSPEFIGSRNCVPMAFTAESPPAQGQ